MALILNPTANGVSLVALARRTWHAEGVGGAWRVPGQGRAEH